MLDPNATIALSAALFGLGILGVFVRRNAITVLLSLQLMLAASVLALVSFDHTNHYTISAADNSNIPPKGDPALAHGERPSEQSAGQGFGVLILSVCTAQVTVALGLLLAARRERSLPDPRVAGEAARSSPW
jgi:NADH:ubiquinone oxidoreductase subunit K